MILDINISWPDLDRTWYYATGLAETSILISWHSKTIKFLNASTFHLPWQNLVLCATGLAETSILISWHSKTIRFLNASTFHSVDWFFIPFRIMTALQRSFRLVVPLTIICLMCFNCWKIFHQQMGELEVPFVDSIAIQSPLLRLLLHKSSNRHGTSPKLKQSKNPSYHQSKRLQWWNLYIISWKQKVARQNRLQW